MGGMKITARQRVLAYIRRQAGVSAGQIGAGLKMSAPAVRHHLGILESDGRIVSDGEKRLGGRGRPARSYRLSNRVLGENFAMIADALLKSWPGADGNSRQRGLVRALAAALLRQLDPGPVPEPAASALARLVDSLNALHYAARWEAGAEGPRIVFGNCPYAAIIEDHPELCQMDALALGHRMQADATQTAKIDLHGHGPDHCVFVLRPGRSPQGTGGENDEPRRAPQTRAGSGLNIWPSRLRK